jgi:predicted nuclease with TOPRIM domain
LSVEGTSDTGKTNTLAVIFEDLADVNIPTLIIERVGALTTVRHEDDNIVVVGAEPEEGIDLVVPLEELDQIGSWVLDKGMKILLDVSTYADYTEEESRVHLAAAKAIRSLNDRAHEKYRAGERTKSLLSIDEAHYMAPKDNAPEPELDDNVKQCRGQIIKACTEGGNKGISAIVSYQRRAFLHNGVISLCKDWIVHGLANEDAAKVANKLNIDRDLIDSLGVGEILARGDNLTDGELVGPTKVRKRRSPDPREETFEIPETPPEKREILDEIQESIEERSEQREREKGRIEQLEEKVERLQAEKEELEEDLKQQENLRGLLKRSLEEPESSEADRELAQKIDDLEDRNQELRQDLEQVEDENSKLGERLTEIKQEKQELEQRYESELSGVNSLKSAFQQLGITGDGEVTVEGVTEDQVESLVREQVEELDVGGTSEPIENVQDAILQEFQEEAVDRILDTVDDLSEMQRKLLLFIEGRGKNVKSKTQWAKNAIGQGTSSRTSEAMQGLEDHGFVETNSNSSIKPTTKEMVRDELSGYDVGDNVVEETYQQLLGEISDVLDESTDEGGEK